MGATPKKLPREQLDPLIDEMRKRKQWRLVCTVLDDGAVVPEWDSVTPTSQLRLKDQTAIEDLTQLTWEQFLEFVGFQPPANLLAIEAQGE